MRVKAKKSLGQHFLRSKTALTEMIDAAEVEKGELVLEIGPGEGVLTERLLESGARVIAVETDERCIDTLKVRFQKELIEKNLLLVHGDIRNSAVQEELFSLTCLGKKKYKLVANIPYYITGMLFRLFLEKLRQPSLIVFLVQKEVAEQATARNGKEGILSLSIKAFGDPRFVAKVKREAFSPPPKVDSAILAISNIDHSRLPGKLEKRYFEIVKAGLGSRRKMLFGNLVRAFKTERDAIERSFISLAIEKQARGEDLSFDKWVKLTKSISL